MADLISRQMAIEALRKMLYKLEEEREEYYIKEKKVDEWFIYIRPNVQDMNDLDVETIDSLPSASPWHTGTPTEEGYYLCHVQFNSEDYESDEEGYDLPYWFKDGSWGDESVRVIAWRKIEPYKED